MELTELEREILHFALDHTHGYLTDLKETTSDLLCIDQLEALKTLTKKLLPTCNPSYES